MTTTNQRAVEVLEQALKVAQRDMEHYFQRATKAEARVAEQSAAGFSWDGHMVHGDRASIEAVKQSLTTRTPGWRPISEAPRDGTMFLVWMDAVRCGEDDEGRQVEVDVSECDFAVWRESEHGGYIDAMSSPRADREHATHFMPLPPPPEKE